MGRSSHRPVYEVAGKQYKATWAGEFRSARAQDRYANRVAWWRRLSLQGRLEYRRMRDGIDPDPLVDVRRCVSGEHRTLIRRQWGTLLRRLPSGRLP